MLFSDPQGQISDKPPTVSFLDHGFLFGDSIYEAVRTYSRKLLGWKEHRERLLESARRLWIPIERDLETIERRMGELLGELNEPDAAMRIIVTRGIGPLNINTKQCERPLIYMAAWKFEIKNFSKPVTLAFPAVRRNPKSAQDPAIKSGNYLNSVMALRQAQDLGYDDAILMNPEGEITELTTSNVGWIANGKVMTPHDDCGLLAGVTRRILLETHTVETGRYHLADFVKAEEVFALSTFKEILPVTAVRLENGETLKYSNFSQTEKLRSSLRSKIEARLKTEREWY